MDHAFWHDKWHRKEIGFHQASINQYLSDHWGELGLAPTDNVFVPLCGKSKDIFWINQLGHPVLGVELSPIACKDLFEEANLTAQVKQGEPFSEYSHDEIKVLCGDFFSLTKDDLSRVKAVYDRAALIALPEDMRKKYATHLTHITAPKTVILLVTMEYPQREMQGPPFSVSHDEVLSLYAQEWEVTIKTRNILGHDDPFAKRKGLTQLTETAYELRKRH